MSTALNRVPNPATLGPDGSVPAAQIQGTLTQQLDRSLRSFCNPTAVGVGAPVTLYTVPAGANQMLRLVRISYLAATDQTLTLTVVPSAAGATTDPILSVTLTPANSARPIELFTSLLPGDAITAQGTSATITVELLGVDVGGGAQAFRLATGFAIPTTTAQLPTALDRTLVTEIRLLNTGAITATPVISVAHADGTTSAVSFIDTAVPPGYYGPVALQDPIPLVTGDIMQVSCAQAGVLITVSAVVFTNVPTPQQPIPDEYLTLYNYQVAQLALLEAQFATMAPLTGSPTPLVQGADLLAASGNVGAGLVAANYFTNVIAPQIDALYNLGCRQLTIAMTYPTCLSTAPNYAGIMAVYNSVVTRMRAKPTPMQLCIKVGVTFSGLNATGLTFSAYATAKQGMVQDLVTRFSPEFIQVISEPDTEVSSLKAGGANSVANAGADPIDQLNTVAGARTYVTTVLTGLVKGTTKVFAGAPSWMPPGAAAGAGNAPPATGIVQGLLTPTIVSGLDGINVHIYPIYGSASSGVIKNIKDILAACATAGVPVIFDEVGLYKSSSTETTGIAATYTIYARDVWEDIWAALDGRFYVDLRDMCRNQNVRLISWFWLGRYAFKMLRYNQGDSQKSYNQLVGPGSVIASQSYTNYLDYATTSATADLSAMGILARTALAG